MRGWFEKFRPSWLLVIGFALVYFGFSGATDTFRQIRAFLLQEDTGEYLSDEGFAPYAVPMGDEAGSAPELVNSRSKPTRTPGPPGAKAGKEILVKVTPTSEAWAETPVPELLPVGVNDDTDLFKTRLPTVTPTFTPTVTPTLPPEVPSRIVIDSIGLDAGVVDASSKTVTIEGVEFVQWLAPNQRAAGWHTDSALLGEIGNTVLNGHHNINGLVFEHLLDVNEGDSIVVYGSAHEFHYIVTNKMILPEKHVSIDQRMDNARWILRSEDERLTLVTCWPFESNTHRLIVVAQPAGQQPIE